MNQRPPYGGSPGNDPRDPRRGQQPGPWQNAGDSGWGTPHFSDDPARYQTPHGHDPRYGAPGYAVPHHPRGPLGPGYDGPPPAPAPERKRAGGGLVFGRIITGLVSLIIITAVGLVWSMNAQGTSGATDAAGDVGVQTEITDEDGNVISLPTDGMNILLVGSDSRSDADGVRLSEEEMRAAGISWAGGGVLTDTLMILHVPASGARATAVSIPRDTWIPAAVTDAPGVVGPYSDGTEGPYKPNKVNSFYATAMTYHRQYLVSQGVTDDAELQRQATEAGRTMLIRVLQQLTGMKIDHYAEVNLIGFYLLSNAIGGVPVCLIDPVQDKHSGANFPAGEFTVSGKDALAFVRQRHGLPGGDLDRVRRQQAFLASAAHEVLSVGTLTNPDKLSKLVDAADRSLVMDKGFNLLTFAQQVLNLTSGNISFTTIPIQGTEQNVGTSALHVEVPEVQRFFARLLQETDKADQANNGDSKPDAPAVNKGDYIVDVQNGTETSGMAAQTGATVAAAGFQRGQLSDYPGTTPDNQQPTTTIRYPDGSKAAAEAVQKVLGVGDVVADDGVEDGRILVVVGTDMPVLGDDEIPTVAPSTTEKPATSSALPSDAIVASKANCIH